MRVIGGSFGGRRLRAVEGYATRPTSDRVREALFSRIEARYGLEGASVLDVFAGTGALAIEALSRGARRAVCIEIERRAIETLRGNLRDFDLAARARVIGDDYRKVLVRMASGETAGTGPGQRPAAPSKKRFDGVFIDPPYGKGLAVAALQLVSDLALLRPGGWATVEVGRREATPELVTSLRSTLRRVREDVYGDTRLVLYEAENTSAHNDAAGEPTLPAVEVER